MMQYSSDKINFNEQNVMFNNIIEEDPMHVKNFICLMVKQYIYRQRCFNKELSVCELERQITNLKRIEKYNAIKSNRLHKHEEKWGQKSRHTLHGDIPQDQSYITEYVLTM